MPAGNTAPQFQSQQQAANYQQGQSLLQLKSHEHSRQTPLYGGGRVPALYESPTQRNAPGSMLHSAQPPASQSIDAPHRVTSQYPTKSLSPLQQKQKFAEMKIDYDQFNNADLNLGGRQSGHNGSVRGKYGYQIHPKNNAVEMAPQLKYKYNRSFLGGGDGGLIPNEDSNWDRANGMYNARKDYEQMQAERHREEIALAARQRPRFIRDTMRTDDIVHGEGMGEWNDRSSLRPGETITSKRYSSIGTKPLMGKAPSTKRRAA